MSFYDLIRDESRLIKGIPILYGLLCLGICAFLFGCSPPVIEAIAEGVTEGIIDEIEEYTQQKNPKK